MLPKRCCHGPGLDVLDKAPHLSYPNTIPKSFAASHTPAALPRTTKLREAWASQATETAKIPKVSKGNVLTFSSTPVSKALTNPARSLKEVPGPFQSTGADSGLLLQIRALVSVRHRPWKVKLVSSVGTGFSYWTAARQQPRVLAGGGYQKRTGGFCTIS